MGHSRLHVATAAAYELEGRSQHAASHLWIFDVYPRCPPLRPWGWPCPQYVHPPEPSCTYTDHGNICRFLIEPGGRVYRSRRHPSVFVSALDPTPPDNAEVVSTNHDVICKSSTCALDDHPSDLGAGPVFSVRPPPRAVRSGPPTPGPRGLHPARMGPGVDFCVVLYS